MRVVYKTKDERMVITFDPPGIEAAVTGLAEIQDILENTRCEACVNAGRDNSHGTILARRVSQSYVFFEAKCCHPDCGAALALSQRKEESGGGLYSKRQEGKKDPNPGKPLVNNGWVVYRKEEHPQQRPAPAPVQPMAAPYVPASSAADVDDDSIPF